MAELKAPDLEFTGGCSDCGRREVRLPPELPAVGDDFDWNIRDYDGFRLSMLEELAARFPDRTRWTPADLEVVIVEALATVLDQLSDTLDRVTAEAYLETARRPESVMKLLALIGYDAVEMAPPEVFAPGQQKEPERQAALLRYWRDRPWEMERVRRQGPLQVRTQQRMVTVNDYAERLDGHPLVRRASATATWGGSWTVIEVALILRNDRFLDEPVDQRPKELEDAVNSYHASYGVPAPTWGSAPTYRTVLAGFVEGLRMIGQDARLRDAATVGVFVSLTVRVAPHYFQSEVRREVERTLGNRPGGFFEPGRLRFGEDLHASDIIQAVMRLPGVENVCLNEFRRVKPGSPDRVESGIIPLGGIEVAVCDNTPGDLGRGYLRIECVGGLKG